MEYTQLLEKQIIGRLRVDNPWWTEGEIPSFYRNMNPRLYLDLLYPLVTDIELNRAVLLMGPRRVGKTVMLYHTIQKLLDSGVPQQNIIYISVETPIYNKIFLEQLFNLARQILGKYDDNKSNFYVFFDEIQYLKDWEINLKSLVDTYKNVKIVASGSAAAELKLKSIESGAGRFTDFSLPSLTFYEYLHLKGYASLMYLDKIIWSGIELDYYNTIDIEKLNGLFVDYINYGGYPEVVFSKKKQEDPGQFIRHDIIDKVLLRDLPSLYGIQDVQELNSLFTMIAYHSGTQFSYETMSKESGVKKELLKKYIKYLEAAFLIKVIHRTDDTAKSYQRETQFKIYLTNPSLRCALFQPISASDQEIGDMVETAVYAQWIPRLNTDISYANWRIKKTQQGEVDIVGIDVARQKPSWAVEIKWSDRYFEHPGELESLLNYMPKNKLSEAIVTTRTKCGCHQMDCVTLHFIPVACYAYTVSKNTIEHARIQHGL
ncbi:MAG: ATP-binding protein [Muribaculaceae bacterium]|nr:ATP-binding protein [Muribaculaceae bacterium]